MNHYLAIVLLSHGYCESLINAILATELHKSGKPELFDVFEKVEFIKKWTTALKAVSAEYDFDTSSALFRSLKEINSQRNSFAHSKVTVIEDAKKSIDGNVKFVCSFKRL